MKSKTLWVVLLLVLINISPSVRAQELSEPEKNFEHLWKTFDQNYGIFGAKKVDWHALYKVYRPQVTPQATDDELFEIMSRMLKHLNDNHVMLRSPNRTFISGILGELFGELSGKPIDELLNEIQLNDFSLELIKNNYLKGNFKIREKIRNESLFTYGKLSDSIGYFHFGGFIKLKESRAIIDEIIQELKDCKGIIVDVRFNVGGDDRIGKLIADRFADRKRLYMITKIRNGADHNDFTAPKYWHVEPDGPMQFTKPVVLLTHRLSISAAENFALAMRVLPHVTVIGDSTSGCFADAYGDKLPNGWDFFVPYKLFTDHEGFCWEGIGVPPDLRIINSKNNIEQGHDKVLEFAVSLLNTDAIKLQNESSSIKNLRESLAENLSYNIDTKGIDAAVNSFYQAKKRDSKTYYIDEEEINSLGYRLLRADRIQEALAVFELNVHEFPNSWNAYDSLAEAYIKAGKQELARLHYKKALELNPRRYPWEIKTYNKTKELMEKSKIK
jgi:carboxyl-terminal processing protease